MVTPSDGDLYPQPLPQNAPDGTGHPPEWRQERSAFGGPACARPRKTTFQNRLAARARECALGSKIEKPKIGKTNFPVGSHVFAARDRVRGREGMPAASRTGSRVLRQLRRAAPAQPFAVALR